MRNSLATASFLGAGGALASLLLVTPVSAQDGTSAVQADEDDDVVIVTAARIRQGGAQDAKHFRSIALEGSDEKLPQASSFNLEGLMAEHDLLLPSTKQCAQLFCINGQAMRAKLPSAPESTVFVGLGFESGVDADVYRAEPLSLIAVVDRSGSMSGGPIAKVKEGLHAALAQMGEQDRIGIVIYGSETNVHLPVMDVEDNREAISAAIDSIAINGSTHMEAGMKLGYATAMEELAHSHGSTRMMLFSDENANVGDTAPESFMGQAARGAEAGIGLTTIGVGAFLTGPSRRKFPA